VKLHENFSEFSFFEAILISVFNSNSFVAVRNDFVCDIFFLFSLFKGEGTSYVNYRMNLETKEHISC
jgi:hypothetical protein